MYAAADPYHNIAKKPPGVAKRLAPILESRAAEPQQMAIRRNALRAVLEEAAGGPQQEQVTLLDIGCGTGALMRDVADMYPQVKCIGVDPSPLLIEEGQRLARDGLVQ